MVDKSIKILVCDNDHRTANRLGDILSQNGYTNVETKKNIRKFGDLEGYRLILMDIFWPSQNIPPHSKEGSFGFDALKYIREHSPDCAVIFISASVFDLDEVKIIQSADAYFKSHASPTTVLNTIHALLYDEPTILDEKKIDTEALTFSNNDKIGNLISLGEIILKEGQKNPNILGLTQKNYHQLKNEFEIIKSEYKKAKTLNDKKKFLDRIDFIVTLSTGCKNLVDLFTTISRWFV